MPAHEPEVYAAKLKLENPHLAPLNALMLEALRTVGKQVYEARRAGASDEELQKLAHSKGTPVLAAVLVPFFVGDYDEEAILRTAEMVANMTAEVLAMIVKNQTEMLPALIAMRDARNKKGSNENG